MITIAMAQIDEVADVLDILNSAADELSRRGLDQWSRRFDDARIRPYVARAEMWLVRDEDEAVACVRTTNEADPDFWTPEESSQMASYISKLARKPTAERGLGTKLLRWTVDRAAIMGYPVVRLDAWKTNTGLHRYYHGEGWTYLRTAEAPGRNSGALFQKLACPDEKARDAIQMRFTPLNPKIIYDPNNAMGGTVFNPEYYPLRNSS